MDMMETWLEVPETTKSRGRGRAPKYVYKNDGIQGYSGNTVESSSVYIVHVKGTVKAINDVISNPDVTELTPAKAANKLSSSESIPDDLNAANINDRFLV